MAIPAGLYYIRVFQPGYGPKIVTCLLSDLEPAEGQPENVGLTPQNIVFPISGAPGAGTLPAGNYSATIAGSGYLVGDIATQGASLWLCTGAGSNSSSTWQQVSGGGGSAQWLQWMNQAVAAGVTIRVSSSGTIGAVTLTPGTYICVVATPGGASGETNPGDAGYNQIPQWPEPATGIVYFRNISLGPVQTAVCEQSGSANIYGNFSAPL